MGYLLKRIVYALIVVAFAVGGVYGYATATGPARDVWVLTCGFYVVAFVGMWGIKRAYEDHGTCTRVV